jgi:phosphoglycolate phosphatase
VAGWRFAVCTNKREGLSRKLLEALGVAGRFAAICGSDTFASYKPDPVHLTETIKTASGMADRAVMVGDSQTDRDTARNAGVPFVGVTFGYTPVPMTELGPDILIDSFAELPAALQRLVASPAQRPKGQSQSQ